MIQLPYFSKERRCNQPTPLFLLLKVSWTCAPGECTRNIHLRTLRTMAGTTVLCLSQCHLTSPRREAAESSFPKTACRNHHYNRSPRGWAGLLGTVCEGPQSAWLFSSPHSWAGHGMSKPSQSRTWKKTIPAKHRCWCSCT